jgi:hypothetical protein
MASVLSPAYEQHAACAVFEKRKNELGLLWTERTDRQPDFERNLRGYIDHELTIATRLRDQALAAEGLYVAEKFGEHNEWIVELLPQDEREEVA